MPLSFSSPRQTDHSQPRPVMPSNITFDPFRRFRLRSNPAPTLPSSSEEDSDESSPECDRPHLIHIAMPKNGCKSRERLVSIPENGKISCGAPEKVTESTHITITLDKAPHASPPEQPCKKTSKSGVASVAYPSDSVNVLRPSAKSTLIRRVTSKLHISIPSKSNTQGLRSRPSTRTLPEDMAPSTQGPRSPRATIAVSPTLPNSFVSKEHREAALRERGLLPPRKDLSEQEREADRRLHCVPSPASMTFAGLSEAQRLKASWLATNRTSESSDSDCGPPAPPYLQGTRIRPQSMLPSPSFSVPPPDADVSRRSGEGKTDLPPVGRPSICSSVPPLSTSSYLEVLHEDPSEQAPITPPPPLSPANPPIIVSSTLEFLSSPIVVESPISCTFSSHCPGSTLESQSQSDYLPVPEKDNIRSPASRRRTTDSGDRGRKVVGSSLSSFGTRSLSNLRRSVVGSLRLPSSSSISTADLHPSPAAPHLMGQAPRAAISPTIHSLGSILKETRDIEDAESRRLSELAFLD